MKSCPNLMHQGKWQEGLENTSEKKITLITLFVPLPSFFMSMDLSLLQSATKLLWMCSLTVKSILQKTS